MHDDWARPEITENFRHVQPSLVFSGATMRTFIFVLMLAAIAGVAMADTNVTGSWSGSFIVTRPNGESKDSTALLILKQNGTNITGSVGASESEQFPIQKGKIEGDKITLEADDGGHAIKLDLKIEADRMTGEANLSDANDTAKAKLDLKRVK
jgi:hypothetical protein